NSSVANTKEAGVRPFDQGSIGPDENRFISSAGVSLFGPQTIGEQIDAFNVASFPSQIVNQDHSRPCLPLRLIGIVEVPDVDQLIGTNRGIGKAVYAWSFSPCDLNVDQPAVDLRVIQS